ncbi:MAG: hypothetical protein ABIO67_07005 [Mycobacteriales bacterium]
MTTSITAPAVNPLAPTAASPVAHHWASRATGALLGLGIAYIHVVDQGGFPGSKAPTYVGIGYYLLEAAGLVAAIALLVGARRHTRKAWALMVGVALGPLIGFVLSRGPGLPDYTDDKGNWTEPIGIISLMVEGLLLVGAAAVLARSRRTNA